MSMTKLFAINEACQILSIKELKERKLSAKSIFRTKRCSDKEEEVFKQWEDLPKEILNYNEGKTPTQRNQFQEFPQQQNKAIRVSTITKV
uniref:Uncharacterized protein n=1 Tax=Megaselia scalaris TaxID=36166 RepID=T1GD86_MEGSC